MKMQDDASQTDSELHDLFYYKSRALRAEEAFLTLTKDMYTEKLASNLKDLEKDMTSKLNLYSYNADKTRQLQQEFQAATQATEKCQKKALEIFKFNLQAIKDGHELSELPRVDDPDVELESFQLGPVTPTINPHKTILHDPLPSFSNSSSILNGSFLGQSHFPPPPSPYYPFYQHNEGLPMNLNHGFSSQQHFSTALSHSNPIGSSRLFARNSDGKSSLDLQEYREENIFNMMNLDSASGSRSLDLVTSSAADGNPDGAVGSNGSSISSAMSLHLPTSSNIMNGPPDSSSKNISHNTSPTYNQASYPGQPLQPELPIGGAMGLDHLGLDYSLPKSCSVDPGGNKAGQQKWSQIAADGLNDGEWQAVGSKKTRPTQQRLQPMSISRVSNATSAFIASALMKNDTDGANFERMVETMMEKYQLTRPEVIAVLQRVRNERNGDMNMPLHELMRDAEKLFTHNKNLLKPASLTARAKAVADHPEPCDNQLCPARLKLLKYRTELCLSYQTTGTCHMKPGSCVYAHGEAELKPLPKEELCERYLEGKCNNKKCVYAHGASELKNRPIINPADYLRAKSKKTVNGAVGNKTSSDDLNLNATDYDSQGDECSICFETMSRKSRKKLDCGHDAFHYKCLKRWVAGEGDRSCPLCRSNTLLPEEYPRLGSC